VVHQHLGVRPDMGRGRLEVTPQVPQGQPRVVGANIRVGRGAVDVGATRSGRTYITAVQLGVRVERFLIGHTLPRDARVKSVRLDGKKVRFRTRLTNRGLEVLAHARGRGGHDLVVKSK
jgi:hypothetical protein